MDLHSGSQLNGSRDDRVKPLRHTPVPSLWIEVTRVTPMTYKFEKDVCRKSRAPHSEGETR